MKIRARARALAVGVGSAVLLAGESARSEDAAVSALRFDRDPARLPGDGPAPAEGAELAAWRRAAEAGDARAQTRLGVMLQMGRGVSRNEAEALRWFREAAESGDPAAQHYLGLLYLSGSGGEIDLDEATVWLRRCAELNEPESLLSLAWFQLDETRLPHGATHAAALLRNLAEHGTAAAQYGLGVLTRAVPGKASAEDSLAWLREAAGHGDLEAQFQLGVALLEGSGGDAQEAMSWFRRAAARGDARAMRNLGVGHFVRRGVPRDDVAAYRWFWLAARHGNPSAASDAAHVAAMLSADDVAAARREGLAWERAELRP